MELLSFRLNKVEKNIPWTEVLRLELWADQGQNCAVLILNATGVVKLPDLDFEIIKQQCLQRGIEVIEDVVIVQEAEVID